MDPYYHTVLNFPRFRDRIDRSALQIYVGGYFKPFFNKFHLIYTPGHNVKTVLLSLRQGMSVRSSHTHPVKKWLINIIISYMRFFVKVRIDVSDSR